MALGISGFVFIQWVAPFVSEFPEFFSAYYWARNVEKARRLGVRRQPPRRLTQGHRIRALRALRRPGTHRGQCK